MRQQARGFTLIDLMIVVMIIGILASVALPAIQSYTGRAKLSELVLAMSACRTSISEVYASGGAPPGANAWGCETSGGSQYLQSMTTDANGVVTATARNISADVNGKSLSMFPFVGGVAADSSNMGKSISEWRCGPSISNGVGIRYLPSSCRGI